jgi:maltose O-acetyltransferase
VTLLSSRWLEGARKLEARVTRLLHDEVVWLQPAKVCAEVVTGALPHLSLGYVRTSVWRVAGLRIGARARILGPLHITGRGRWQDYLTIGSDCFLTGPVSFDLQAPVTIGDRVSIGHGVRFLTVDHEIGEAARRCGPSFAEPIRVGDGVWLGSSCIILPGVSVGNGAIVAAGAVVTRDVAPNTLVAGVPARIVRSLQEEGPVSAVRETQANALTSRSPDLRALSYRS